MLALWIALGLLGGCGSSVPVEKERMTLGKEGTAIVLEESVHTLAEGFSGVKFQGESGFQSFLDQGGAASDGEVVDYLQGYLMENIDLGFLGALFGCSTLAVEDAEGGHLFGRNFDWQNCEALVVSAQPTQGYASLSTVNLDFITQGVGNGIVKKALEQDRIRTLAALYAPLDGMNEKGLAVAVNMIEDTATIDQQTEKPDLTTTTAVRLLLDQAATVEEALALLRSYDLQGSMGLMVHFALADATGRSVVVEYVNQEMVVTETPVVTNFYLAPGEKQDVGTEQSHTRFDLLTQQLAQQETMTEEEVRDALDGVSKDNFGEFESTEWSIVFNLRTKEATYYHRENYQQPYRFAIG